MTCNHPSLLTTASATLSTSHISLPFRSASSFSLYSSKWNRTKPSLHRTFTALKSRSSGVLSRRSKLPDFAFPVVEQFEHVPVLQNVERETTLGSMHSPARKRVPSSLRSCPPAPRKPNVHDQKIRNGVDVHPRLLFVPPNERGISTAVNYSETDTKEPGSKQAAISKGNRHALKRSREDSGWELEANEKRFRMPEGSEQDEESEIAKIMEILSHDSHIMDFGDGESENNDDEEFSVSQIKMFELELESIADGSNGVDQAQVQAAKAASPDFDEAEEAQVVPCDPSSPPARARSRKTRHIARPLLARYDSYGLPVAPFVPRILFGNESPPLEPYKENYGQWNPFCLESPPRLCPSKLEPRSESHPELLLVRKETTDKPSTDPSSSSSSYIDESSSSSPLSYRNPNFDTAIPEHSAESEYVDDSQDEEGTDGEDSNGDLFMLPDCLWEQREDALCPDSDAESVQSVHDWEEGFDEFVI